MTAPDEKMKPRKSPDMAVIEAFAARLRDLRHGRPDPKGSKAFMPQNAAAARAGLDGSYWGRLERGESDPTLTSLLRIQHALEIDSIETLLGQTTSSQLGSSLREPDSS
jgi:transcriptional regulator with XRE-family HTH domain